MRSPTLALLLGTAFAALIATGCSDDGTLFDTFRCRSNADCTGAGQVCGPNQFCVESDGTPVRDTGASDTSGTLDAGSNDTSGDGPAVLDTSSDTCARSCVGRVCGDDGCGGSCGSCAVGQTCQAGACMPGGGGGDLDCPGLIECVNTNSCTDQACLEGCMDQGTSAAQAQFTDLLLCLSDNCGDVPEDQFSDCQQNMCGDELGTCAGAGSASCDDIISCLGTCGSDSTCQQACVDSGTVAAQSAAIDFWNCGVEACAEATTMEEFLSCARTSCPTEASECDAS